MALEDLTGSGKYIDDLVSTNPTATDNVHQGDDHIRGIKNVLKLTLPNVAGAITPTHTELNYVDGVTSAVQSQLDAPVAKGDGSSADGQIQLNCSQNTHGIKLKSPPHSANASYTLTFPNDDGNSGQKLTTNGSGVLTWTADANTTYSVQDGELSQNNFTNGDHTKLNGIATSANNYVHPNHSGEVTSTADGATVIAGNVVDEANLKVSNAPSNGYFLSAQSGATGGMTWAEVDALPSQSGNAGKFLTTDATNASWAVLDTDANTTTKGLYEMKNVISANYSIASGNNAMSAGPITINSNVSLTIPSGSTFVIV